MDTNFNHVTPFSYWANKILPLVYDDSLSYLELLNRVVFKLNELIQNNEKLPDYIQALIENTPGISNIISQTYNEIKSDISSQDLGSNPILMTPIIKGKWFFFNNILYTADVDLPAGNQVIPGTNCSQKTIEELFNYYTSTLSTRIMLTGTNQLISDCFRTTQSSAQIPLLTTDGQIIGSGLTISDLIVRPQRTANNSIAIFDDRGNLQSAGLDNVGLLKSDNITTQFPITGSGFKFGNKTMIQWGTVPKSVYDFSTSQGQLYSADYVNQIGFHPSFNEKPLIFGFCDGKNVAWVSSITCVSGGITNIRMISPISGVQTLTVNWVAIGGWN